MKKITYKAALLFLIAVSQSLYADVIGYKSGNTLDDIKIEILKHDVHVTYRDGKKERVKMNQLNYARFRPVHWIPQDASEDEIIKIKKEEAIRIAKAKTKGDTWESRHEEDKISKTRSLFKGLTPIHTGLYKTQHVKTAIFFSIMEGILFFNALDFATAKKERSMSGLLFTSNAFINSPPTTEARLINLIALHSSLHVYTLKGGITDREILKPQTNEQTQTRALMKMKNTYYGLLGIGLIADGFSSFMAASDWNGGTWSGDRGIPPSTAAKRGIRSVIFPGWGQIYAGNTLKGSLLAGIGSLLLGAQVYQEEKVSRYQKSYGSDISEMFFLMNILAPEIVIERSVPYAAYQTFNYSMILDYRSKYNQQVALRNAMLNTLLTFWTFNVLDAVLLNKTKISHLKIRPLLQLSNTNQTGFQTPDTIAGIGAFYEF